MYGHPTLITVISSCLPFTIILSFSLILYMYVLCFLQELVRMGIPHHFRGIVWQLLCNAYNSPLKAKYAEYLKMHSTCEKVIRRDIARTYPEHEFFKEKDGPGQETLFNVMKVKHSTQPSN